MKTILPVFALLILAGCQSIAEKVEIPADTQASTAAFQYPVVVKPDESVVYVVNKKRVPHKWDGNLIFQTEFEITGASATAATVPGEYAILKIRPGSYEVWASRICHAEKGTPTPPDGTVMEVREVGWKTYRHFYGRKFSESDDGNLHLVVKTRDAVQPVHAVEEAVYGCVRAAHGSVAAEHGVGLHRKDWLGYSRTAAELALMRQIKTALDPAGILNPGKVL